MNKPERVAFLEQSTNVATLAWMDDMINLHKRGATDLERRRADFELSLTKPDGFSTPVNQLSWFVNEVNNIRMNGRLDMAVNHAASLAVLAHMKSEQLWADEG